MLAGSGVKMWIVLQDVNRLKQYYNASWETFIANAGMLTAFANADLETLGYITRLLGNVPMLTTRPSGAS